MRAFNPAFAAAIAAGATTLCACWRVTRRDGLVMGFTDHDRDLVFDGTIFAAMSGATGSDVEQSFDFSVGGGEIAGALAAEALTESDLAKGLWDDAAVELFIVDWSNVEARHLIERGAIGEARRAGGAFAAELRGLSHRFDEERGRRFSARCDATLGDSRCGVDLSAWRADGAVSASDGGALIRSADLAAFDDGLFRAGSLRWTGGANAGFAQDVRDHRALAGEAIIELWSPPPAPVAAGDAFTIAAGCDKSFATCRDRFANIANFRGFPHLPGSDLLLRVARDGEPGMDGGSLFR